MKFLPVLAALAGLLSTPSMAGAQLGPGDSVALILVTWIQGKSAEASVTTAQTVVGHFNDEDACIKAAKEARLSNGATALMFNFMCVPSR